MKLMINSVPDEVTNCCNHVLEVHALSKQKRRINPVLAFHKVRRSAPTISTSKGWLKSPTSDISRVLLPGQLRSSLIKYTNGEICAHVCKDVSRNANAIKHQIRASDEAFGGGFAQLRHCANGRRHTRNVLILLICFLEAPVAARPR
jgi:hypothetical protein